MAGEYFINKLTGNDAWSGTLPTPTPANNPTDGPWKHLPGSDLSSNQTTTSAIGGSHYWLMDGVWNQHTGNMATFFGITGSVFKAYPGCSPEWTSFFHLPSSPFDENGGLQNAIYIKNPGQYADLGGTGQTRIITLTHGDGITGDGTGAVVEVSLRDLGTYTRILQAEVVNPGSGYTTVAFDLTGKPAGVAATVVGEIGYLSWVQHAAGVWKVDLSTGFYISVSVDGNGASPAAGLMSVRGVWDRETDKRLRLARYGCITKITLPTDFVTTFVTPPVVVVTTTGGGVIKAVAVLDPTAAVGTARRVTDIRITYQEAGSTADPSSLTVNAVTVNGVVYERIDATPTADVTDFSWRWDTTGRVLYVGSTAAPDVKIVAGPNSGAGNLTLLALANRNNYEFHGITFRGANYHNLSFIYSVMSSLGLAVTGCTFSHPPVVRWGDTLTVGSNGSGQFPFYLSAVDLGCSYGTLYGTVRQFQFYGNSFLGSWNTEANDPSNTPFGMQFSNAGITLTGNVGSPAFMLPGETNPIRWNRFEDYAGAGVACMPANLGNSDYPTHNLLIADNEFTAPLSRSFRPVWLEPGPYALSINLATCSRASGGPITGPSVVTTKGTLLEGMGLTNATLNADTTAPGPLYLKQVDNRRSIRLIEGAPTYSNTTTYVSGNVVYSTSPAGCYKCILGHKNQPVTNGTYWTALTLAELPVLDARALKTGMLAYGDYCASIVINSIDYANNLVTLASNRAATNYSGEITFFFNDRFEIGGPAAASLTSETVVAYHKATPNNIVICNNKIYDVPHGIQVSGNNVWIHNNVFHKVRGDTQHCALRNDAQFTYQHEYGGEAVKIMAQYIAVGVYAYLQFADNIKVLNNLFYDVAGQGVVAFAVPGTSNSTVRNHPSVWNLRVQGNIFLDCMQRMGDVYMAPRGAVALVNMSRYMPVMGGAESSGTFGLSYGTPPFRNLLFDRGEKFEGIVLEDNCVWDSDGVTMPELAIASYHASASTVVWYNGTRVTATTSDAGRYTRTDLTMRNTLRANPKVKDDYSLEYNSPCRVAFNVQLTSDAYDRMRDLEGVLIPAPKANMGPSQS